MADSKRATVYLDAPLHRALRLKAAASERSVSALINEAVRSMLAEDAEDLAALEARRTEPSIPFVDFVQQLRAEDAR